MTFFTPNNICKKWYRIVTTCQHTLSEYALLTSVQPPFSQALQTISAPYLTHFNPICVWYYFAISGLMSRKWHALRKKNMTAPIHAQWFLRIFPSLLTTEPAARRAGLTERGWTSARYAQRTETRFTRRTNTTHRDTVHPENEHHASIARRSDPPNTYMSADQCARLWVFTTATQTDKWGSGSRAKRHSAIKVSFNKSTREHAWEHENMSTASEVNPAQRNPKQGHRRTLAVMWTSHSPPRGWRSVPWGYPRVGNKV